MGYPAQLSLAVTRMKQIIAVLLRISSPYKMRMDAACPFKRTFRSVAQKVRVLLLLAAKGHNLSMAKIKE